MAEFERILVRGPNWIGDQVMALDFFAGLRQRFPSAQIWLAAPPGSGALHAQWFDGFIPVPVKHRKLVRGSLFWTRLRAQRFQCAVSLPSSISAAWLLACSGAPVRVGYADPGAAWLYTRSLPWRGRASARHKAQLYRDLLSLLGGGPATKREPPEGAAPKQGPIVIAPGASIELREWPYFVELVGQLRKRYPANPVCVVGTADSQKWVAPLQALGDPMVQNLVGKTSLLELAEVCRKARAVIANDSGVAHVAATVAGAPVVVLFGPGDPAYVAPQGRRVGIARAKGVACSPCESAHCRAPYGYKKCLKALGVDEVLDHIAKLI